jgi:hypothetical protein
LDYLILSISEYGLTILEKVIPENQKDEVAAYKKRGYFIVRGDEESLDKIRESNKKISESKSSKKQKQKIEVDAFSIIRDGKKFRAVLKEEYKEARYEWSISENGEDYKNVVRTKNASFISSENLKLKKGFLQCKLFEGIAFREVDFIYFDTGKWL